MAQEITDEQAALLHTIRIGLVKWMSGTDDYVAAVDIFFSKGKPESLVDAMNSIRAELDNNGWK